MLLLFFIIIIKYFNILRTKTKSKCMRMQYLQYKQSSGDVNISKILINMQSKHLYPLYNLEYSRKVFIKIINIKYNLTPSYHMQVTWVIIWMAFNLCLQHVYIHRGKVIHAFWKHAVLIAGYAYTCIPKFIYRCTNAWHIPLMLIEENISQLQLTV